MLLLGHIIKHGFRSPNPKNVKLILEGARPKTLKDVQRSHSLLNYFADYIPNYDSRVFPIRKLLKETNPQWTDDCEIALQDIATNLSIFQTMTVGYFLSESYLRKPTRNGQITVKLLCKILPLSFPPASLFTCLSWANLLSSRYIVVRKP